MSHFLLYLPGATGQAPKLLEEVGLADFHAGAEFVEIGIGPDEGRGMLLAWRKPGTTERLHFNITEQTWLPANRDGDLAAGRYWVGFWNDAPPTPRDLARPYPHQGQMVALADGNSWLVPCPEKLPHDAIQADDGTWRFELQRKYHHWFLETRLWVGRIDPVTFTFSFDFGEVVPFLVRALALNYRLTSEVASHLHLFNTENLYEPMMSAIGFAGLRERIESHV